MAAESSDLTSYQVNSNRKQSVSPQDDGTKVLDLILLFYRPNSVMSLILVAWRNGIE